MRRSKEEIIKHIDNWLGCGKELEKVYMDGSWKHCGEFGELCGKCSPPEKNEGEKKL